MSAVSNPLQGLIDGLLQGHQLGMQLHRQAQEDQAFKTNQALHDQQMSVQDIMNQQMMNKIARPVTNGMVTENAPAGPEVPSGVPGGGSIQAPGFPGYVRKAKSPTTLRDSRGGATQWELKSPEEQQQAELDSQIKTQNALELAKGEQAGRVRESMLKLRGVPVPEDIAAALRMPAGSKVLPEEIPGLAEHMPKPVDLQPGGRLINPTTGALIASGGPPNPTGDFEKVFLPAFALKHGLTPDGLAKNPDLTMQAVQEYAQKSKDPESLRLAHQMTQMNLQLAQARLDDLRAKGATAPMQIDPGSREYKIAQNLAYGKLTMQQFRSLTAYSRDTNKKMDIYDKASELNPNFNPAQFEMGFKFAGNPKTQQQLASMDNVTRGIDDLLKFSDAASRTGVTALNKVVLPGGLALGGKKYSDFHTAQIAFADELSGALGFGGATDMSKQMGFDMTNPNLSPENFRSAIENVVKPFVDRKRQTLLNQMGVYGQPGMNPSAGISTAQSGGGRGASAGGVSVTDPRGGVHTFPNQQAADAFKQAAGIR